MSFLYFSEATWEDGPEGETIITFVVPPRDTPGLVFKDGWHTWGCARPLRAVRS